MINFFDLQSLLVLVFVDILYKLNGTHNSAEVFARMTAIINLVAMAYFSKAIYYSIFERLLATDFKDKGLLSLISTCFNIVETNGSGMLYLHCLM